MDGGGELHPSRVLGNCRDPEYWQEWKAAWTPLKAGSVVITLKDTGFS
jgi:hypothetical protein